MKSAIEIALCCYLYYPILLVIQEKRREKKKGKDRKRKKNKKDMENVVGLALNFCSHYVFKCFVNIHGFNLLYPLILTFT